MKMRRTYRAIAAFFVTFTTGAVLSFLLGVQWRQWIVGGIVTASVVAISVFRASRIDRQGTPDPQSLTADP